MIGRNALLFFALTFAVCPFIRAQDPQALSNQQNQIAENYRRAEMLMLKMAQVDAAENPRRAALLKKVLSQSKEKYVRAQMETLVKSLQDKKLGRAIDDQVQVRDDLKLLLQLLETENRTDRIKNEQARVRQYIRELQRIIRKHKSVQGRTEGGDSAERLAGEQEKVAERADQLSKQIEQNESTPGADPQDDGDGDGDDDAESSAGNEPKTPSDADAKPSEDTDSSKEPAAIDTNVEIVKKNGEVVSGKVKEADEKSITIEKADGQTEKINAEDIEELSEQDPADNKADGQNSSDSEGQPGEPSQAPGGQPSDSNSPGKPTPGQPSPGGGEESQNQESPSQPQQDPPQQSFPGQQRISEAEKKMRDAQKQLEDSEIKGAIQEQEKARQLLEQAKAELEEILRQLREEEVERTLARLESRFKKMLESQIRIYEDTKTLGNVPVPKRNNAFNIKAGKLGLEERRLVADADRALLLLLEEGSSVSFPEVTQQIRDDMAEVVERLTDGLVGQFTQGIEEEIISALEEVIEALQKAQRDNEERKEKEQKSPPMQMQQQQQEDPLVDSIAELKMIRSMQIRINKRTQRMSRLLEDVDDPVGQITKLDQVDSLRRLAAREERLKEITRDIVMGKNR